MHLESGLSKPIVKLTFGQKKIFLVTFRNYFPKDQLAAGADGQSGLTGVSLSDWSHSFRLGRAIVRGPWYCLRRVRLEQCREFYWALSGSTEVVAARVLLFAVEDNIEGSSSAYVSPIWKYFEKYRKDETKAKCKMCDSFRNRSGSSTNNLIKHLKTVHKINSGCRKVTKKVNESANKTILAKKKVDTELDRLYVITELSQCLVPKLANEIQEKLITFLEQRDVADVVLTTDAWTSKSCDNYEALTAHFICKNFVFRSATLGIAKLDNKLADGHVKLIEKLVNNHKRLIERVTTLTSDNAEVMKSAKATALLNTNCLFTRIIRDNETRWSSVYFMLERFLERHKEIYNVLSDLKSDLAFPSLSDLKDLAMLRDYLKPFQEVTTVMSSEKNITASSVIYLVTELMRHATDFSVLHEDKYKLTAAVAASMRASMLERGFPSYASNKILLLATTLDARYKTAGLPYDEAVPAAKGELFRKASLLNDSNDGIDEAVVELSSSERPKSIFDRLDENRAIANQSSLICAGSRREVESYLTDPTIGRHEDPLQWWKARQDRYPRLSILARKALCIIVNSVPCERIFSKMGLIITDRRQRLSHRKAGLLGFIAQNLQILSDEI
ncbi:Uncharacterized protein APZ42_032032 [Daphnia magna]|uniref:BED-type domain-containing protein n=1 Tax=Daphnia magna TaxID=35525 RepID=A0A164MBW1_9CRUS|nr:Uncharacterized protein APZ42_032032 [Daphnia magna]